MHVWGYGIAPDRSPIVDRERLALECQGVPLLPIRGGVLLMPGSLLPLHVCQPDAAALVKACIEGKRPVVIPHVRDEGSAPDAPFTLHPYAGIGVIAAHHEVTDGRYNVLIQPVGRVLLGEILQTTPFRIVQATLLPDLPGPAGQLAVIGARVRTLFSPIVARMGKLGEGIARALQTLPAERVAESLASVVLREADARQAFLATDDMVRRARMVEDAILLLHASAAQGREAEA